MLYDRRHALIHDPANMRTSLIHGAARDHTEGYRVIAATRNIVLNKS